MHRFELGYLPAKNCIKPLIKNDVGAFRWLKPRQVKNRATKMKATEISISIRGAKRAEYSPSSEIHPV